MPRTFWTFLIATIAIAGIPPLAGFFSKDEILWKAYQHDQRIWMLGFAGAALTAFYMFRLVFMTFFGECRADEHTKEHLHESSGWMTWPLVILAAGSVLAGFLGVPPALGGSNVFEHWLEPVFHTEHHVATDAGQAGHGAGDHRPQGAHGAVADAHGAHGHHDLTLEYSLMAGSVGVACLGIFLAFLMYDRRIINPDWFSRAGGGVLYKLIYNKYYVDEIYYATFLRGTLALSRALGWFDRTVVDGVVNGVAVVTRVVSYINGLIDNHVVDGLVNFIANFTGWVGGLVRRFQTGSINAYLYGIVVVVTAVLFASTW